MNSRTYYDILGVSREATLQEITSAKNALAKVYHPDANMNQGIDTTACMQEILEAYRVLSNPESRHEYDKELGGDKSVSSAPLPLVPRMMNRLLRLSCIGTLPVVCRKP